MKGITSRKLKLFLVSTAILVSVCRCIPSGWFKNAISYTLDDGSPFACYEANDFEVPSSALVKRLWVCSFECPDGKKVEIEYYPMSSLPKGSIGSPEFHAQLNEKYCGIIPPSATEETPTSLPPVVEMTPLLTGEVTACNLKSNYVNFRLTEPPQDITGKNLDVTINGVSSDCSINPSYPSILTCTLSPDEIFPINVEVRLDGILVNSIPFDGSGCVGGFTNNNQGGGDNEGGGGQPPTEPPPPLCSDDPNNPNCVH